MPGAQRRLGCRCPVYQGMQSYRLSNTGDCGPLFRGPSLLWKEGGGLKDARNGLALAGMTTLEHGTPCKYQEQYR